MRLELISLPDELIIDILTQSVIDLNTLGQLMIVSRRIRHLALHILNQYRLPSLQIALTLDQEGKNRITSKFHVDNMDPTSLSVTFNNMGNRPRRYYSNRATPIIRNMMLTDNYEQKNNSIATSDTYSSFQEFSDDSSSCSNKESNNAAQKEFLLSSCNTITNGCTGNENIINHKIQKKKEGLHILEVSRKPASWKLSYKISQKEGHEYHLFPSTIKIQLYQLLLLEETTCRRSNKSWRLNIINWVTQRNKAPFSS